MMGNGYGVHGLAVGPNTSCEFAGEVFAGLIQGSTPEDNARDATPTTVDAHSPATSQDYDMDCVTGQDSLITCSGGVGAAVYMFLPGRRMTPLPAWFAGSWTDLPREKAPVGNQPLLRAAGRLRVLRRRYREQLPSAHRAE